MSEYGQIPTFDFIRVQYNLSDRDSLIYARVFSSLYHSMTIINFIIGGGAGHLTKTANQEQVMIKLADPSKAGNQPKSLNAPVSSKVQVSCRRSTQIQVICPIKRIHVHTPLIFLGRFHLISWWVSENMWGGGLIRKNVHEYMGRGLLEKYARRGGIQQKYAEEGE